MKRACWRRNAEVFGPPLAIPSPQIYRPGVDAVLGVAVHEHHVAVDFGHELVPGADDRGRGRVGALPGGHRVLVGARTSEQGQRQQRGREGTGHGVASSSRIPARMTTRNPPGRSIHFWTCQSVSRAY